MIVRTLGRWISKTIPIGICAIWMTAFLFPRIAIAGETELAQGLERLTSSSLADVGQAIETLVAEGSPEALEILNALNESHLVVDGEKQVFIAVDGEMKPARPGSTAAPSGRTQPIKMNNVLRRSLDSSLSRLRLSTDDIAIRLTAAEQLTMRPSPEVAELLRARMEQETDPRVLAFLRLGVARADIEGADVDRQRAAADYLGTVSDVSMKDPLARLASEGDPEVRDMAAWALARVERRVFRVNLLANTLYGLSLASVLLLAALGLAITFGLMGVINMAHGEMLMIGAYSTYVVQGLFLRHAPGWLGAYLIVSIPVAFIVSGAVGVALERTVIRRLYGRPLETLLATWGLSLILIQTVRSIFGAQNVSVAVPDWLSGGWTLMPTLVVPYTRIAVLVFTAIVVTFVWLVLARTSLGLRVRAVTQNREMAAAMGIATHRVDMWTFGLGSGVAGLGGVALSQLGNVGPELGQQHIIDSFMVVVLGGVGSLFGTVVGAVSLGVANKFLEPSAGAVLGKILILGLLILFIQWKPSGLFALKGRSVEN